MDIHAKPPLVVEAALRSARIGWEPTDNGRGGVFRADKCPHCDRGPLIMSWIGAEFVFRCPDGGSSPDVVQAFGIDPDDMPRTPTPDSGRPEHAGLLPPPNEPMKVAREFARERHQLDGTPTLRHWRGGWWQWRESHWVEVEQRAVRAPGVRVHRARRLSRRATRSSRGRRTGTRSPTSSTRSPRSSTSPRRVNQPAWIDGATTTA